MEEKIKVPKITLKEIISNPILKPYNEFLSMYSIYENQETLDAEQLKSALEDMQSLTKEDAFAESSLVPKYYKVEQAYQRILYVYTQIIKLSQEKMQEIKKIVEEEYISREEHRQEMQMMKNTIESLKQTPKVVNKKKTPQEEINELEEVAKELEVRYKT